MTVLRIILGDQLSLDLSALHDLDAGRDTVLMMEVMQECCHVRHHKQKIVLVLSAMRHFAQTLRQRGLTVDYATLRRARQDASHRPNLPQTADHL
jgi:deoxyribodipyrimidine photolyase-related protein